MHGKARRAAAAGRRDGWLVCLANAHVGRIFRPRPEGAA